MGTIRFVAPGFSRTLVLAPGEGDGRTLLAIAQQQGIPILFNCEAGGCGACIVHVDPLGDEPAIPAPFTYEERFLLEAMGKFHAEGMEDPATPGARPHFRLACQYVLGDEDIVVDFTNELGSV